MIIVCDTDEFLRQFVLQVTIQYAADFPDDWIKPCTEYDMAPFFQIGKGIYNYFDVERAKEIYANAPVYSGAKEFLETLMLRNHEVWIASKQKKGNEKYTLEWIEKNKLPYHSIAFTPTKHHIKEGILIDDSESNLKDARKNGVLGIAIDRPWNQNWDGARAKNFDECLGIINQIEGFRILAETSGL